MKAPFIGPNVAALLANLTEVPDRNPWYVITRVKRDPKHHHPGWKTRAYYHFPERILCRALEQKVVELREGDDLWAEPDGAKVRIRATTLGRAALARHTLERDKPKKQRTYGVVVGGPGQASAFFPAGARNLGGAGGASPGAAGQAGASLGGGRGGAGGAGGGSAWTAPPGVTSVMVIGFGGGGGGGSAGGVGGAGTP